MNWIFDNKKFIYPVLMVLAGCLCGVILYNSLGNNVINELSKVIEIQDATYSQILSSYVLKYICAYLLISLLGLCLIGYPFIYASLLITAFLNSIKLCYYYSTYSIKGVGYSLLLLIPEATIFIVLLMLVAYKSVSLSRSIYLSVTNRIGMTEECDLKSYLKDYLLYFSLIVVFAIINSSLFYLLSSIVDIKN